MLDATRIEAICSALETSELEHSHAFARFNNQRQPVHVVYGGAQLFKATTLEKLAKIALNSLDTYLPSSESFSQVFKIPSTLGDTIYELTKDKLNSQPIEDYRIDFEDGFGYRSESEEAAFIKSSAQATADLLEQDKLPPYFGIRIRSLLFESKQRALFTLSEFLRELFDRTQGQLPKNFVITLPKVTHKEQISALVTAFKVIEQKAGLETGSLKLEIMLESPHALVDTSGKSPLLDFLSAARERCRGVHFGAYDYLAELGVTSAHQSLTHPHCEFARSTMLNTLSNTGVFLSDGATTLMPIAPYKGQLNQKQKEENQQVVHRAWQLAFENNMNSLRTGFYQGWDLHPAQLVSRYAATFCFFHEALENASLRLKGFIEKASQASLTGSQFDDAATGQGLLNFFLRGINCGALEESALKPLGISKADLESKSFGQILKA